MRNARYLVTAISAFLLTLSIQAPQAQQLNDFISKLDPDTFRMDTNKELYLKRLGEQPLITIQNGPEPSDTSQHTQAPVSQSINPIDVARSNMMEEFAKIAGGSPGSIEEFPWNVVLVAGNTPDYIRSPFCGGSIVGYQWILTAAHCLKGITSPGELDIISGSAFPKFPNQGDRVHVAAIYVSPIYNSTSFENDIALLKLERAVGLGQRIRMAEAATSIENYKLARVSGWGAVTAYTPMVDRLLFAEVPVISAEECMQTSRYRELLKPPGMMCAGYREGGYDACQGDSGGPLVTDINGIETLIGVVSWGLGCAERLRYGVYTRVSNYSDWVNSVMNKG